MAEMLIRVLSAGLARRRQDAASPGPVPVRPWNGRLTSEEAYRLGQFALQFLH